jgi:diguanylate cyclase (GGDEF)-like protein/PAS domain S-box-containing protein
VARLGLKSSVAVPLTGRAGPLGVMRIDDTHRTHRFTERDVEFLSLLGNQLGLLVENSRLLGEREQALRSLKESEERYAGAVEGPNLGLWDWDLVADRVFYTAGWRHLLGLQDTELSGSPEEWFDRIHPDDRKQVKADVASCLKGQRPHLINEHRIVHSDGNYLWVLARGEVIRGPEGRPTRLAGSLAEITERKKQELDHAQSALEDDLTELPNRVLFLEHLRRCAEHRKRRSDYLYAVFYIDLDRFKVINETLGYEAGDELLVATARRMEAVLRPGDTLARFTDNKFGLLLEDLASPAEAMDVAETLFETLSLPFSIAKQEIFVSASVGIVIPGPTVKRFEDALRNAEMAMYRAKSLGGSRYVFYDEHMRAEVGTVLKLETDLRRALQRGEFRLHFQPIMEVRTGHLQGFETLLRWHHPERGLLLPGEFIDIAEETGLIVPIGRWVLREALSQAARWSRRGNGWTLSVNLCAREVEDPGLLDELKKTLSESSFDPGHVVLEIPENQIMRCGDSVAESLAQLRALRVHLHIDDFGTGYCSLSHLQRFPVDSLKIDREFVKGLGEEKENEEIVRAIIQLAHNLHMRVIAEGVENETQLEQLRALDCEYAQGHFFQAPGDAESASRFIGT